MTNHRLSSWVIRMDISDQEEVWLHGYTGAVDIVEKQQVEHPVDEVKALMIEKGYLTSLTIEEEQEKFFSLAQEVSSKKNSENIYVLQFSVECNFACTYCFENSSRKHTSFKRARITQESMDGIEAVIRGLRSNKNEKIILFGGEPLLEENRGVIERALEMRTNLEIPGLEVITNGYNVDQFLDLLSDQSIVFQITIDGTQEIHESRRIKKKTVSSYQRILNNVRLVLERGQKVELRVNVDEDNYQTIPSLFEEFATRGLGEFDLFAPYLAYTLDYKNYQDGISPKILYEFFSKNASISQFCSGRDPLGLENALRSSISGNIPFSFTTTNCGGNKGSMFVFAPDGRIQACWDCGPGDEEIGRYFPEHTWNIESYESNWLSRRIENLPECKSCRYALFCGGGCQYLANKRSGSYHSAYCNGFQELFDEILYRTTVSLTSA